MATESKMTKLWRIGGLALTTACVLCLTILAAEAAKMRGLSVDIKGSPAKNAPIVERVNLYRSSYALVIGNDDYHRGWQRLSNAVKDARQVAAALIAKGFHVTLKTDLTSKQMEQTFKEFFIQKGRDKHARLFIWYAGHGHTLDGEGYLVPVDGRVPSDEVGFLNTAMSLRDFGKYVRYAKAKHVLTIFDSCFAGTIFNVARSAIPPAITRATTMPVRQFLSSGDAGQQVSDDGSFARLFIQALNNNAIADANSDGYLTGSEIGSYLTYEVSNVTNNLQTPRYGKLRSSRYNKGDFVFALKQSQVRPKLPNTLVIQPKALGPYGGQDIAIWNAIKDSNDPRDYGTFIASYPNSPLLPFAKSRAARLDTKLEMKTFVPTEKKKPEIPATAANSDTLKQASPTKNTADQKLALLAPNKPSGQTKSQPAVGVYKRKNIFRDCADCPRMKILPAGSYTMGSTKAEQTGLGLPWKTANAERPAHLVSINYRFAIGVTEITNAEFEKFVKSSGRAVGGGCYIFSVRSKKWLLNRNRSWRSPGYKYGSNKPVTCISWDDAYAYTKWLSKVTGKSYGLLSEAEWEYAARAGTSTRYFWGEKASKGCRYANIRDLSGVKSHPSWKGSAESCRDGYAYPAPVGRYKPNPFGLYDMLGNVWEWMDDCWNTSYSGAPTSGAAWVKGYCGRSVFRGGGWDNDGPLVRAATRASVAKHKRFNNIGFRIARNL